VTERILASASPGEVRVAVLRDAALIDYAIWRPGAPDGVGDVYRGRVLARVPAMAGAFVSLDGTEGFLPDSQGGTAVTVGDSVTVRVTRAPQGGKGARLAVVPAADPGPSGLLEPGPGALLELAAQYPVAPILVDDGALVGTLRAKLGDRLRLVSQAFDEAVEEQVAALAEPIVPLKDGGKLSFHPTPALVAIDIDAGRGVAGSNGRRAAHIAANRAAMPVLAQQVRLRNLSGAILVDLAGLSSSRRAQMSAPLEAALTEDPLRPRLLGFTRLGLAEIVRPRIHPPLHELLDGPHAAGLAALRRIAIDLATTPWSVPVLCASPAVLAALQADTAALPDLARRAGRPLIVRADPRLETTAWRIETDHA
jgi:Ribonuclease G/E